QLLKSGRTELVFEKAPVEARYLSSASRPEDILSQEAVLESGPDYILPSGKHTDTFVNIGKLCQSEGTLGRVAAALHELFADLSFDTIVTNGWAMATLARRLAALRRTSGLRQIHEIMCEGYNPPVPTE